MDVKLSIEIVFITSSKMKLAHAQHLCKEYNIKITGYRDKHYGKSYEEPRIYNREELLNLSYNDALERWKKYTQNYEEKMFLIEDTSVIIDGLSTKDNEVPGLDIKYWMKENTFDDIDKLLKSKENNRNCTVRSDIILHLSEDLQKKLGKQFLHLTSKTKGKIVDKEKHFNTNPIYPWLDNKTFNKWFIPSNEKKPMSMLRIDVADKYDFRAGAFNEMLDVLESLNKISSDIQRQEQKELKFEPLFILCGPTCSGKSTLATYISDNYGYFHIEASDFMWLKFHQKHGVKSDVKIGNFAKKVLEENPSIVTDQISYFVKQRNLSKIIISGFRSEKEIEFVKNWNYDFIDIQEIYIDADINIRFKRELKRNRKDIEPIFGGFEMKDNQQFEMGLKHIKKNLKNVIKNESTLDDFYIDFEKDYIKNKKAMHEDFNINLFTRIKLEQAILFALFLYKDDFFSTTEISKIINNEIMKDGGNKHKNNISRYFNQKFYPYYDIDFNKEKDIIKYKINYTGISQVKWLLNSLNT